MSRLLKLGTRKSLLAWAQSQQIARAIEQKHPEVQITLVGIETQGDRILGTPLQQVEGKDFFVAELDRALEAGTIDFSVHSLKDLSLIRPPGLYSAMIPKRENPRDVALFGNSILKKLRNNEVIRIGTSSPRRIENTPLFLEQALPRFSDVSPRLEWVKIRGNVNTRLQRLHLPQNSPRCLDGVILSFAGLIRLWADEPGQVALTALLESLRWMILPLRECPTAPGQGALALECRKGDSFVRKILSSVHHPQTAEAVAAERQLLEAWGGGCHQKFGATQISSPEPLMFVRGRHPSGHWVEEVHWDSPPFCTPDHTPHTEAPSWDGSQQRITTETYLPLTEIPHEGPVFVAHARALRPGQTWISEKSRVWTSGTMSWFQLASRGIWVEGCAEALGFQNLIPTLQEKILGLSDWKQWICFTHQDALKPWVQLGIPVLGTYQLDTHPTAITDVQKEQLKRTLFFFWKSESQYDALHAWISPKAIHACGFGKTADFLKTRGVHPLLFPSVQEWKQWLSKHIPS